LEALVPEGLQLQRLGPDERFALFTFLTYRHGHFGPRWLGPLRQFLPSPLQSNWRVHVVDPHTGRRGITFVMTAIGSTLHALAARHLSEGVAMHVPASCSLDVSAQGSIELMLDPGPGSAPDVRASLHLGAVPELSAEWQTCFKDFNGFLEYCVPQDRALDSQPWYARVSRSEIDLGIPLTLCQPLQGEVVSTTAARLVGSSQPLCFYVPQVQFKYFRDCFDAVVAPRVGQEVA